jgi:hypothetical protein
MYIQGSSIDVQNSKTLKTDQQQHDRPTAYVVTQQYSSLTAFSVSFYSSTEKKIYFSLQL